MIEEVAARWQAAFAARDPAALGSLLDENVRWGPPEETPETCHTRSEVLNRLAQQAASGVKATIVEAMAGADAFVVGLHVIRPQGSAHQREHSLYQVLSVRNGLISSIRGYPTRAHAAAAAGVHLEPGQVALKVRGLVPILSVSDLAASFAWFQSLGWSKKWAWGERDGEPSFGSIESGGHEIFLSLNTQGQPGMWLSVWVDDVAAVHAACIRDGLEVIRPPQNEPWGLREMHVRHPDGHVLRVSQESHTH